MSETVILPVNKKDNDDFGKYQFVSELGDGAMGTVYKCFDPDFHRMVAIKTVHQDLLTDHSSGEFRERFKNEMRAAGKLTHPNIVSVFDAGEKDNSPYYVMEFVEGQDLKCMMDTKTAFSLKQSLSIIKCVLRGLSNIHKNGITHRDLKPANIFVSKDGVAKIADFGIAKLDNSEMTQIGTIIGSPKYMSPEQCVGEAVDTRTDLFATGIILYELLTGTYCFKADSASAMTQKIINVDIVPPTKIDGQIPRYLDKVLKKALHKDASQRFQNALDFLNALDEGKKNTKQNSTGFKTALIGMGALVSLSVMSVYLYMTEPLVDNAQTDNPKPSSAKVLPASTPFGSDTSRSKIEIVQLSPEKTAKIAKLFKVAETYQRIGRLVSPAGSNAFDAYKIVLNLDPQNERALSGLVTIETLLIQKLMQFKESGDVEQASLVATAGQEVFPNSTAFSDYLRNL